MSIVTKTGDDGTTGLMYGRRVSKSHPRVEAYGAIDELSAAIGVARANRPPEFVLHHLIQIQKDLIIVMGELATMADDLARYVKDGYSPVTSAMPARLETVVKEIETQNIRFQGWALPGECLSAAALHVARTVCRRAERHVCALQESGEVRNREILVYLNRVSDLLWLMARWVESRQAQQ